MSKSISEIKADVKVICNSGEKLSIIDALAEHPSELVSAAQAFIIDGREYDLGDPKVFCFIDSDDVFSHVIAGKFLIKSGEGQFFLYRFPGRSDHEEKVVIECDGFVAAIDVFGDSKAFKVSDFDAACILPMSSLRVSGQEFDLFSD